VSIQDERELSERLGELLGGVDPRPAPVGLAVSKGRSIRRRRRTAVAAGLAVIAAGAVLGPTVIKNQLAAPPVGPRPVPHFSVTVSPPPRGAKAGVIAVGSINDRHWQATLSGSGKNVGATFSPDFSLMGIGDTSASPGDFAVFDSVGGNSNEMAYVGPATPSVRYLTMSLSNGQTLTLRPQPWAGQRYVAMVLPQALRVTQAVAYGARGELGYAIPFNYQGTADIQTWLRPGQTGMAEVSAQIGAGGSGRTRWSVSAFIGPWGQCVRESRGGGFCAPAGPLTGTGLVSGEFGGGVGAVEVGLARYDVTYLLITRSDGSVIRVEVDHVGAYQYGLVAMIQPKRGTFTGWVAYDQQNKRLGGGTGDPLGAFR
jgi:hypothetical protein